LVRCRAGFITANGLIANQCIQLWLKTAHCILGDHGLVAVEAGIEE
jgi:hypothetical protein